MRSLSTIQLYQEAPKGSVSHQRLCTAIRIFCGSLNAMRGIWDRLELMSAA